MRKEVVSLSCLIQIKEGYSLLSKNEKKVADYILSHPLEVYDYSVQQLAESSGTSPSCIIRFVKKIGFESYTQFRLILAKESERQLMSSDELIEEVTKSDSIPEMLQKFKNFNINTINKTFENLDEVKIKKAVDILRKAKKSLLSEKGLLLLWLKTFHINLFWSESILAVIRMHIHS
jgi:DNA-binding MurR/RpiR family transcriptional regulator